MTAPHADKPTPPLLEALPTLVAAHCERLRISQRAAARELGLGPSTITRIVQGKGCDAYALLVLLPWLGLTSDWLEEPDEGWNAYWRGWNDAEARMRSVLDSDRPGVPPLPEPAP